MDDREQTDTELMRRAERALTEIDRAQGLSERHADILAALRIRIEGGPRKSLEELMKASGEIKGTLEERLRSAEKPKGSLDDLLSKEPKKKGSLDDLLKDQ